MLKVLTAIVSLAAGFVLVEIGMRVLLPSATWKAYEEPNLGWTSDEYMEFKPEADPPVPGVTRILFLGDSYLAGSGLRNRDDRFPIVLADRGGASITSKILATGGWGTDQELLAFVQKGQRWQPDIVILAFTATNDLRDNASNWGLRNAPKPYFVVDPATREIDLFDSTGRPVPWNASAPAARAPLRSHLLDLLVQRYWSATTPEPLTPEAPHSVDPRYLLVEQNDGRYEKEIAKQPSKLRASPQLRLNNVSAFLAGEVAVTKYPWKLLEGILLRLHAEVEASGAELIVVLLPSTLRPNDARFIAGSDFRSEFDTPDGPIVVSMAEPRRRLQRISEEHGITFFDPTPEFIRRLEEKNLLAAIWPRRDTHFSQVGHAILADQLLEFLSDGGYLEGR